MLLHLILVFTGSCSNENCPYRHVHVNPDSSVCESFLRGYCPDGNEVLLVLASNVHKFKMMSSPFRFCYSARCLLFRKHETTDLSLLHQLLSPSSWREGVQT